MTFQTFFSSLLYRYCSYGWVFLLTLSACQSTHSIKKEDHSQAIMPQQKPSQSETTQQQHINTEWPPVIYAVPVCDQSQPTLVHYSDKGGFAVTEIYQDNAAAVDNINTLLNDYMVFSQAWMEVLKETRPILENILNSSEQTLKNEHILRLENQRSRLRNIMELSYRDGVVLLQPGLSIQIDFCNGALSFIWQSKVVDQQLSRFLSEPMYADSNTRLAKDLLIELIKQNEQSQQQEYLFMLSAYRALGHFVELTAKAEWNNEQEPTRTFYMSTENMIQYLKNFSWNASVAFNEIINKHQRAQEIALICARTDTAQSQRDLLHEEYQTLLNDMVNITRNTYYDFVPVFVPHRFIFDSEIRTNTVSHFENQEIYIQWTIESFLMSDVNTYDKANAAVQILKDIEAPKLKFNLYLESLQKNAEDLSRLTGLPL